jgi:hypothetical protein
MEDTARGHRGAASVASRPWGGLKGRFVLIMELKQCGVCARFMSKGYDLPSGNRDPRTGKTPCDNFICWRCTREAERNWFVKRQAALMKTGGAAVSDGARKAA